MEILDSVSITGGIELHGKPAVRFESHSNGESFYLFEDSTSEEVTVIDPVDATDAFLSANGSRAFLRVFRKYGRLRDSGDTIALAEVLRIQRYALALRENTFEAIAHAAPKFRAAMDRPVTELLTLPLLVPQWSEPLSLHAHCKDMIDALALTLFLDTAHHRQRLICARPGCENNFLREEGSKQKFCDPKCAQRAADANYKKNHKAEIATRRRQRMERSRDGRR